MKPFIIEDELASCAKQSNPWLRLNAKQESAEMKLDTMRKKR